MRKFLTMIIDFIAPKPKTVHKYGLYNSPNAAELVQNFAQNSSHREGGVFLGKHWLWGKLNDIMDDDRVDGFQICCGIGPGNVPEANRPIIIVMRAVKFQDDNPLATGNLNSNFLPDIGSYSTIERLGNQEPPVAGCPPINCN